MVSGDVYPVDWFSVDGPDAALECLTSFRQQAKPGDETFEKGIEEEWRSNANSDERARGYKYRDATGE